MNYKGNSLEDFTERKLGKVHRRLATTFNLFFNMSASIAGVIFSVNFVNFVFCQLGYEICGSMITINIIGLIICLPIALISNISKFVYFAG